jgi:hypothetical protein
LAEAIRKQKHRSRPMSQHPLFPAIVALWFAALLGVGSFGLSLTLLERIVLAASLDSLLPAAAPPLGITAQLLLAAALGAIGAAIGWALARRIAATDRSGPAQVFKVADADPVLAKSWPGMAAPSAAAEAMAEVEAPVLDPASLAAEEPAPPQPELTEPEQTVLPAPSAAQRIASAKLAELSHLELMERLAIALQRRQERLSDAAPTGPTTGPVVRFPASTSQEPVTPPLNSASRPGQETEKALREALTALQRMSGRA